MSLSTVINEMNTMRHDTGMPTMQAGALTTDDAADLFTHIDDALTIDGYVRGMSYSLLDAEDQTEHVRLLSAVVDLMQEGFNPPMTTRHF